MLPHNPLDLPPQEYGHTWCNYLQDDGSVWQTLYTDDMWAYCFFLIMESYGVQVIFFKRIAPVTFSSFGGFREGLEKTEEWFAKHGIDIPGWAAWIQRYHVQAQSDSGPADHEGSNNGLIIGGPAQPFYWSLERFYAEHLSKPAA